MSKKKTADSFACLMREWITEIYLVLMLLIYPLFMGKGYAELVYKKWDFFLYVSLFFILLSIIFNFVIYSRDRHIQKKRVFSGTDKFVLLYLVCVFVSYLGAADKGTALWGIPTWYMGAVSQLLFAGIYFALSRGFVRMRYIQYICGGTYILVCSIVLLQRFGFNPFYLYKGMTDNTRLDFVTTLGQVTWSSSYITILLIAGIGTFFADYKNKIFTGEKKWLSRMKYWLYLGIGFMTISVLNCDSAVIALIAAMLILIWLSLGSREGVEALLSISCIAFIAIIIIGIGEKIFSARMVTIDTIYLQVAGSIWIYVLLAVNVALLILTKKHRDFSFSKKKVVLFRRIYIVCIITGIMAVTILFILHGKGYFAGSASENYFRFTIWWGNSRGFIWRTGAAVFSEFNIFRKFFGCGPDGFTSYAYQLMGSSINQFWHNQIVPNVHNEWFNSVINYGLIGGMAYFGIFASSVKSNLAAAEELKKYPELLGIGLAAAGYLFHNILCYQQIVGTPLIFILIGIGDALFRQKRYNN